MYTGGESMNPSLQLQEYKRRLMLINILGAPFYAAFAMGGAAHFKGNAIIGVLEDANLAFYTLLVGAIGGSISLALAMHTAVRTKRLEDAIK
jgi:hypothetical protein